MPRVALQLSPHTPTALSSHAGLLLAPISECTRKDGASRATDGPKRKEGRGPGASGIEIQMALGLSTSNSHNSLFCTRPHQVNSSSISERREEHPQQPSSHS